MSPRKPTGRAAGRPKGATNSPLCPTCGKRKRICKCEKGVAPPAVETPPPAPAPKPETPAPLTTGVFAAARVPEAKVAAQDESFGVPDGVYQAPALPQGSHASTPPAVAPLPSAAIDAAVASVTPVGTPGAPGAPADPNAPKSDKLEKHALTADEIAQLRAISVAGVQAIFFLNNWAVGKYYYKTDVLDMPPPVPNHVAQGADLLQPMVTRMIGTHTNLGAVLAFGAVLSQHNVALSRQIARDRAAAKGKELPAATDDTAADKAALDKKSPHDGPPAPSPPPDPGAPVGGIDVQPIQLVDPGIRRPGK